MINETLRQGDINDESETFRTKKKKKKDKTRQKDAKTERQIEKDSHTKTDRQTII